MIAVCSISEGRDSQRLAAVHDACCSGDTAIMTLAVVPDLDRSIVALLGRPDELVAGITFAVLFVGGVDDVRFLWLTESERTAAEAAAEALSETVATVHAPVAVSAVPPFVQLLLDVGDRWVLADAPATVGIASALLLAHPNARAAELLAPCPAAAFEGWPDDVFCENRAWAVL